jgi:hypothetical protein
LDQSDKRYWKYGIIYMSLTYVVPFFILLNYYGRSLQIRIMWYIKMF